MRYSLRSLMIVVLLLPPLLAGLFFAYQSLYHRNRVDLGDGVYIEVMEIPTSSPRNAP
jgi:hypothetical protein